VRQFKAASPFVIGIYCGTKKPGSITDYLQDFMEELPDLLKNGIHSEQIHYSALLECFVCDAPARSFIKNVKSHNGYHGRYLCKPPNDLP
jgi:hypothetical protein